MTQKSTKSGEPSAKKAAGSKKVAAATESAAAAKKPDNRSQIWATIVYPESAPENWREILSGLLVPGFVSPLHSDPDTDDQTERKPHHHVMLKFSSKKSREQVAELTAQIGGVGQEKLSDWRTYARYLCHLDQPLKKSYDPNDVMCLGGTDYLSVIEAVSDKYRVIGEIIAFVDDNPDLIRYSFARLLRFARDNQEEWFRHLCTDCAYVIKEFMSSVTWEAKEAAKEADNNHAHGFRR